MYVVENNKIIEFVWRVFASDWSTQQDDSLFPDTRPHMDRMTDYTNVFFIYLFFCKYNTQMLRSDSY